MSPGTYDNENARNWFDSVEEMAFSDEDFCDNSRAGSPSQMNFDPCNSRRKVQALQAAYAVCLYQNWEGSDRNKRRIRRYRYSTVVAVGHGSSFGSKIFIDGVFQVARDLGLGNAQHKASQLQDRLFSEWHEFAIREEFIR
jgi:hypothetical protein